MVWTDHEDDGLDPTDRGLHAGNILYWLATIVAGLIVIFVIAELAISWGARPTNPADIRPAHRAARVAYGPHLPLDIGIA